MATPCPSNTRQVYAKTAVETSGHPGKKPCRRRLGRDRKVGSAAPVGLGSITPSTVRLIHRRVALEKVCDARTFTRPAQTPMSRSEPEFASANVDQLTPRCAPRVLMQSVFGVRSGRVPPPGPLPGTGVLVLRRLAFGDAPACSARAEGKPCGPARLSWAPRFVAERRADISCASSPLCTVGDGPDSGPREVA
jgi:hypothetical protein